MGKLSGLPSLPEGCCCCCGSCSCCGCPTLTLLMLLSLLSWKKVCKYFWEDFPASFLFYLTFWNDYTRHSISTRLFIPKINYYDIKYCLISVLNWNHILCDWKRRFYVLDLLQSRLRNLGPSRVENRPYLDLRLRIYQLISLDFSVSSTVSNFKSLQIIVYLLLICRSVCQISSSLLFWKKFN